MSTAFREGKDAYYNGWKVWENPYKKGTAEYFSWRDGYEDTAGKDNI